MEHTSTHTHTNTLQVLYGAIVYLSDARAAYVFDGPNKIVTPSFSRRHCRRRRRRRRHCRYRS